MNTLLCPIYLSSNALSKDRFSIGLIMVGREEAYFNYSEEKLNKVKHLFTNDSFLVVKKYLKSVYKNFYPEQEKSLFPENEFLKTWANKQYLSYLNKYTNNLVCFGETTNVDIALNEDIFKKFFEMYVFRYPSQIDKAKDIDILKKPQSIAFYERNSEKVNIDIEITNNDIDELLISTKVNFLGKNDAPFAGNMLNLQNRIQSLGNNINSFISLTKILDNAQNKKGKYFIVGEEPSKELKENHKLWRELRNTKLIEYTELPDIDRISDYITEYGINPYFAA
ncbi:hypothetical protein [Capnocytophaga gingivalis]|uniref:hypothetical protein n=1 Tax=Capnocytophaga gingivalis TaxID=1017 RepID=UPI0023F1DF0B|nr:hypothetical protein [Capnocytophaga gingivalis]